MPPSSKPNVPICGASLSASADCGVGIICSLDCPAHAARMEVDRISVIIFVTAGLDRKHIILKCLKRGKHKVNLLICSTRADITDEQSRDAVSLKKDMRMTSQEKYSRVARWLHWIIAVLVIAGLALGLLHERLENVLPSAIPRSEEHTSELQSLMRISYAVFCLKKKKANKIQNQLKKAIAHAINNRKK